MQIEQKAKISKFLNNLMALLKIALSIFLGVIVITWAVQIAEIENFMPIFSRLIDFFTNLSQYFYTPTKDDEESFSALMYIAISIVFFLLIFESITDILSDILKVYDKTREQALIEENEKINQEIQKNYKSHLKASMRFVVMLTLSVTQPHQQTQAFEDEALEQSIKQQAQKMMKEIYSMITMSIKCTIKSRPDLLILGINDAEQLNRILFFIQSVCQVEKYQKAGLGYYMSVTAHLTTETAEKALHDANNLLQLRCKNKILCYGIIPECLALVRENNFKALSNGQYGEVEDTVFELVNKN